MKGSRIQESKLGTFFKRKRETENSIQGPPGLYNKIMHCVHKDWQLSPGWCGSTYECPPMSQEVLVPVTGRMPRLWA